MKVLIPEDIPSSNKGEAALFEGIWGSLSIWNEFELYLFSSNPKEDKEAYGNKASVIDGRGVVPGHILDGKGTILKKTINYMKFIFLNCCFIIAYWFLRKNVRWFFKNDIWRCFMDTDLIIMAHDSFYAPLYHGTLILTFRIIGKPVVLYGSTIMAPGDGKTSMAIRLRNTLNRFFFKYVDLITVREKMSYKYLKKLKINEKRCRIELNPDFAFLGSAESKDKVLDIFHGEHIPYCKPIVGLAISQRELAYAFPSIGNTQEKKNKAILIFAELVDHITQNLGASVLFVPHSIGPSPHLDDRIAAGWIIDKVKNQDSVFNMIGDYSPIQLKGVAAQCKMTIGTRLHFTIDAISMRVPSILITHEGEYRCHGIVGDMAGQKKYLYNIEHLNANTLAGLVDELWKNVEEIQEDLIQRMPEIERDTRQHAISAKKIYSRFAN